MGGKKKIGWGPAFGTSRTKKKLVRPWPTVRSIVDAQGHNKNLALPLAPHTNYHPSLAFPNDWPLASRLRVGGCWERKKRR